MTSFFNYSLIYVEKCNEIQLFPFLVLDEKQARGSTKQLSTESTGHTIPTKFDEVIDVESDYDRKSDYGEENVNRNDYLGLHDDRVDSPHPHSTHKNTSWVVGNSRKTNSLKVRKLRSNSI